MDDEQLLKALGDQLREREAAQDAEAEAEGARIAAAASDRFAGAVLGQLATERATSAGVVPLRRRRVVPAVVAAVVAVAAVLLLMPAPRTVLPTYSLELSGDTKTWRSTAPASQKARVKAGASFTVVLRPAKPIDGAVAQRAFVRAPSGLARWDVGAPQVSEEGGLRYSGALAGEGVRTLVFVVGSGASLDEAEAQVAAQGCEMHGGLQVLCVEVELLPP